MSGGKGGSSTSSVEIPEYIEAAAQRNLSKAEGISQLGYVPYYGPDVAALTPMQQAAMQNVAGAASAFGMATPTGQDVYGMPAPTTFAGGIQGYSSAPMFEQAQAELARQRPAQKSYIDSFFIDPYTGEYAYQPFDYTTINTMAEDRRQREAADRATQLAVEGIRGSALTNAEMIRATSAVSNAIGRPYNPTTDVLTPAERAAVAADPAASQAQDTIAMNILGDANLSAVDRLRATPAAEAVGAGISFANPASTGSYGGSLVTGRPSESSQDIFAIANAGSANTTTAREDNFVSDLTRSLTDPNYDPLGNVITRTLGITDTSDKDDDGKDDSGGGGDGCVVATHAVNSGAFTPSMKREAVVWCMHNLHDKWWGEAIRRGYRHLGRKKIEQGKAHEHYQEFRNYIDFASGKKRTIKGAIHFAARTVQFFAVGLVKGYA